MVKSHFTLKVKFNFTVDCGVSMFIQIRGTGNLSWAKRFHLKESSTIYMTNLLWQEGKIFTGTIDPTTIDPTTIDNN